ncbi:MAG: hypothetical protein IPM35_19935 [Myxococcales bacterium]|nr:hypothetical protein [Myxococcales bacterium]
MLNDENWLLPLNQTAGIDIRGRKGIKPTIDLPLAEVEDVYHLSWAGDASSVLVAIEMPTTAGKAEWDLSDKSGRVSPTMSDVLAMAAGDRSKKRGSFIKYSWLSVLAENSAPDHFGEYPPLPLHSGNAVTLCHRFDGGVFTTSPPNYGMYGDLFLLKPTADTFGYLRHYDIGACSAAATFSEFVNTALWHAQFPIEQPIADAFPGLSDKMTIRVNDARLALVPRLADVPTTVPPSTAGSTPFRTPVGEGIEVRLEAKGVAETEYLGGDITCSYVATYEGSFSVAVNPTAGRYYNRVELTVTDKKPSVKIQNCDGTSATEFFLSLAEWIADGLLFPGDVDWSLEAIAQDNVKEDLVRRTLRQRFEGLVDDLNQSLIFPVPTPGALQASPTGAPLPTALFTEWARHQETSVTLYQPASGPAGSCLSDDLRYLDNGKCSFATIEPTLAAIHANRPRLADALRVMVQRDPKVLECRPIRGGTEHAKASWHAPTPKNNFSEETFARFVSGCAGMDNARLLLHAGEIFQGCVSYYGTTPACKACWTKQDGGNNCDLKKLRAGGCLTNIIEHPPFIGSAPAVPQVSCSPGSSSPPGTVCVPRFHPGTPPPMFNKGGEQNAMCVPMHAVPAVFADCAPCLAMVARATPGALEDDNFEAEVQACLATPPRCRTVVGNHQTTTCNATNGSKDAFLSTARDVRLLTPYRCGIRLPISRLNVEPDQLDLVLAEASPCPNGASPPCRIDNVLTASLPQANAVFWAELAALAAQLNQGVVAPGFAAPGCYPTRTEVLGGFNPETANNPSQHRGAGPMGVLGQGHRQGGWTRVLNSPICGWQDATLGAAVAQ